MSATILLLASTLTLAYAETIVSTPTIKVLSCPKDIEQEYNGKFAWVNVDWVEPRFYSSQFGRRLKVISTFKSGNMFFLGYRTKVVYQAAVNFTSVDVAECSFTVLVKARPCPCPTIRNPDVTALACTGGKCVVLCKDGYHSGDTQLLFCTQGQWMSNFTPYPAKCVPGKNWYKTYQGNVSDPAVVDNIKQLALDAMQCYTICSGCRKEHLTVIGGL